MNNLTTIPHTKKACEWKVAYRGSDVIVFAEEQGWGDVRICGKGKMITSPIEHSSGWKLIPRTMDDSSIPPEALQRLKILEEAGYTFQGEIIAHEPQDETTPEPIEEYRGDLFNKKWLKYAGIAGASVVLGPVALVGAAVATVMGIVFYMFRAVEEVALYDPALILCCHDGVWIQLYVWLE